MCALALLACGPRRNTDAGFEPDRDAMRPLPSTDSDEDGLCDDTERSRGTDPSAADTDGDGFDDLVELQIGADPLSIASPDRNRLVHLPVARLATSSVSLAFRVRAEGGIYVGGFGSRPRPFAHDESSANDFFLRATALAASPPNQVALVEGERFVGVVGRTLLTYQLDFEYRDDALLDCMRAYPFTYQVKLEDGAVVGVEQRILFVAPRDVEPGRGTWCRAQGPCF